MKIKITFKTPQTFHQCDGEAQGMFIFCDWIKPTGVSYMVYSDKDLNYFLISDVVKIELS